MEKGTMQRPRGQRRRQGRRSFRLGLWVIAVVGLLVLAGAWYLDSRSALGRPSREGDPAPPFVLRDSEGRQVALADYLGRKPVLLVFYMTYG